MRTPAPAARVVMLCAALALLGTGCSGTSAYARSRGADLADSLPMSVAWGWGIAASIQATPLLHLGLGATPVVSVRYGWDDRTFNGAWHEYEADFPWTIWLVDMGAVPPRPPGANEGRRFGDGIEIVYRWQATKHGPGGEDYDNAHYEPNTKVWGRHPPTARETGGALVIPEYRRAITWLDLRLEQGDQEPLAVMGTPARATLWEARRDGPSLPLPWDLFEVDLFAVLIGVRVGFRPLEFGDFLVGLVGFDPAGDDIHATTSNTPEPPPPLPQQPQPVAPPAPAPAPAPVPEPPAAEPSTAETGFPKPPTPPAPEPEPSPEPSPPKGAPHHG